MADVDVSTYAKPATAAPQKSLLDQVQQYQTLESGKNTIDKQKLDLVNQRFGEMAKGFTGLIADKDLTEDKVRNYITNQVKLGYVPAEMAAQTISQLPPNADAATLKKHLELQLQHAQSTVEAINYHYGSQGEQRDGANTYSGVRLPANKGGGFIPATQTSDQIPPTAPQVDNQPNLPNGQPNPQYGSQGYVGPSGPAGPRPVNSLPAVPPTQAPQPSARMAPAGPINGPAVAGPSSNFGPPGTRVLSAVAEPPTPAASFNDRIGAAYPQQKVATSLPPGQAEAIGTVAASSGKDMAADLSRAKNYKADLYPSERVLDIVKEQGAKAFGPGTEGLNTLKSALVTWLPNVDQKTIDGVSDYEQAKKYLVQAARSNGSTGTNDQLAAAFEANPNVKMSGATIENVVKSNIALRKMQHAQTLLATEQGVQPNQYSQWTAKNQNVLDPRAFGFDMMDRTAQQKLLKNLEKDPAALKKFKYSLDFADKAGLISP